MADAITALWNGNNYQARVFWNNALNLLRPNCCVAEVTFEASAPKAFDDVVVKYDPPIPGSGPERITADYQQIKWHVQTGGRFGYEDFVDPRFIGAAAYSLLQRLQKARSTAPPPARFTFLTTYRITDGDPLALLVSGTDKSLLMQKLFDGTGDGSKMGKVRKLWREHLNLDGDYELRGIVERLRVIESSLSLEELRSEINLKAELVGLVSCSDAESDFRYDELARRLKDRRLSALSRQTLLDFCRDEGLLVERQSVSDPFHPIAIRSFLGAAADQVDASPDDTLMLTEEFQDRYLKEGLEWQASIRPKVEAFLRNAMTKSVALRLIMDAHASIALLAGTVLHQKSGVLIELVQKGRVGTQTWRADDGSARRGNAFTVTTEKLGSGPDIAVAISVSRSVEPRARRYIAEHLSQVGKLVSFQLPAGPGQQTVAGGEHAAALAEAISNTLLDEKATDLDAMLHLFAACPNSLLFYLGQQHQGIAPSIVYEYDFDRRGNKTYQPSFAIG